MRWCAIVTAAGRGTRFGRRKQLVELHGRPLVAWSVGTFAGMDEVAAIVVVCEADEREQMEAALAAVAGEKLAAVVPGGETRQESVARGLAALPQRCDGVFVHDGARPLVSEEDVRATLRAVRPGRAAVLATPVVDTIKRVDERGHVVETLPRSELWAAYTPQAFSAADLRAAHEAAERDGVVLTDDVALAERIGIETVVVPAQSPNPKVTHPADLTLVQTLAEHDGQT
ncbi:MAG TPA: 2-C-methyl-D-erythritol 4-phosphate cytidylyltransferase [Candidatus Dormibacteraeota bacterium]|nr:2-C-methyl-D-erythritol 4-phosphate cytidylyltransferase [Candidatus Dormibacteraeota bacterium]